MVLPGASRHRADVRHHTTMQMEITLLGVDFSWAPLQAREQFSYDADQARALLADAVRLDGLREAVLLSTCNRTEFFLVGDPRGAEAFLGLLQSSRPGAAPRARGCALRRLSGDEAVRHLFGVASGVASLLLGDPFILRQLKQALAVASSAGSLGPVLSRAFHQAFHVGRQARTTTDIARGEVGLGAVVAATIAQVGTNPKVLLLGAGATGRDIARQIAKRGRAALTILNRTEARAVALARACGARVAPWSALRAEFQTADVVICATAAQMPIVRSDMFGVRVPLLVDVGVPRNIDPPAGVRCLVIDDLTATQDESRRRREQAIPAVHALVDQEIDAWQRWLRGRPMERIIRKVFAREGAMRRQLAADLVARGWQGSPDEAEEWLAHWTRGLLKGHAAELRQWAGRPGPDVRGRAANSEDMR